MGERIFTRLGWWNETVTWGLPMLLLMLGTGAYLTLRTRGVLFTHWRTVWRHTGRTLLSSHREETQEGISPFQAVATALAGTVGTGNIVGVALAISLGGAGAIFWMWMAALLGMVTKYAEVTLAVAYRERKCGLWTGGAMLYMEQGLGWRRLSKAFCLFGMLAAFGIGNMVQVNSMASALREGFAIPPVLTGAVTLLLAGLVLMGGIRRIARVAERLVPLAALLYLLGACAVLVVQREALPRALGAIVSQAVTGRSVVGGVSGVSVQYAMRIGVARGLFTNEAGLGSAPIAHATAENWHPARQGLWGAFEVFFDTIVMCTITALVILTSGLPVDTFEAAALTQLAFAQVLPYGGELVTLELVLFAFSTLIAWYYYGERCADYLGGSPSRYRLCYLLAVAVGAVLELELVWELADLFNGLMALPNLLALILLAPTVQRLTEDFFRAPDRVRPKGCSFRHLLQGKTLR